MAIIAIDPGHGKPDPGAVGPTGLTEAFVVLDVAHRLASGLCALNHDVLLTRENMVAPLPYDAEMTLKSWKTACLLHRVQMARDVAADLFVSIHCNGFDDPSANGWEIYCNPGGLEFGTAMYTAFKERLKSHRDRRKNVLIGRYYVLRRNEIPAVICELEFITNPVQEGIFKKENSRQFYADTILTGILNFLKEAK